mgnify:CR=1 FL=1
MNSEYDLKFLLTINQDILGKSKAQLRQDIFVLSELGYKRNGFFVEFGAANGIDLSNTYLLEKEFGWKGILAEPAIHWHKALKANRDVLIDDRCVWHESGKNIIFNQTTTPEFSTIDSFSDSDYLAGERSNGRRYLVETISLMDLLEKHGAPKQIDYLSIDTEGSEYSILKDFDFTKYDISVITCEHNNTPVKDKLFELFKKNGFTRKHQQISAFDDWYVKDRSNK